MVRNLIRWVLKRGFENPDSSSATNVRKVDGGSEKNRKMAIFHDFFAFFEKMPWKISMIFGMELDIDIGYQLAQTRFS